jgi:hypothetical protein
MQPTTPTIFEEPTLINRPDESRYAMDDKLYVEFFREPVMHQGKSREAGRAVYEERDFVRIHVPGDKTTVCVEPMHEINLFRFRARYEKWKAGQSEAVTGTPLSAMPGMTPSKVEEYKFFKIVTVEQLAEANDQLGQKFMSFNGDKARAKAFIEVAKGNAPIEQMNAELAKRDEEIETLKAQMAALMANTTKQRKVAQPEPQEA